MYNWKVVLETGFSDIYQIYATSEERQKRNRQAAAASRERRAAYIQQLEATVKQNEVQLSILQQSLEIKGVSDCVAAQKGPSLYSMQPERSQPRMQRLSTGYSGMILQPDSSPIPEEQLAAEIKGIYEGLVTVETKCIDIDAALASDTESQLGVEQWQALIALHRTLLYEHHDFLMATQHPSASPPLKAEALAPKYSMPARMWKHGIHAFLEVLRHRRPDSEDYMLAFVVLAYQMMALLYEAVPCFTETWIECLGDLARYRMAIEDDQETHALWGDVAAHWYRSDRHPDLRRMYHHLGILERPSLQKLTSYTRALTCAVPFSKEWRGGQRLGGARDDTDLHKDGSPLSQASQSLWPGNLVSRTELNCSKPAAHGDAFEVRGNSTHTPSIAATSTIPEVTDFYFSCFNTLTQDSTKSNSDVLASVHIVLAWFHSLHSLGLRSQDHTIGSLMDSDRFSWGGLCQFLNSLCLDKPIDESVFESARQGSFPGSREPVEKFVPLAEDYWMRGLLWAQLYLPKDLLPAQADNSDQLDWGGSEVSPKTSLTWSVNRFGSRLLGNDGLAEVSGSYHRMLPNFALFVSSWKLPKWVVPMFLLLSWAPCAMASPVDVRTPFTPEGTDHGIFACWIGPLVPVTIGVCLSTYLAISKHCGDLRMSELLRYSKIIEVVSAGAFLVVQAVFKPFNEQNLIVGGSWLCFGLVNVTIRYRLTAKQFQYGYLAAVTGEGALVALALTAGFAVILARPLGEIIRQGLDWMPLWFSIWAWAFYSLWKHSAQDGPGTSCESQDAGESQDVELEPATAWRSLYHRGTVSPDNALLEEQPWY